MEYKKKDGSIRRGTGRIVKDERSETVTTYWDTARKSYRRFNPSNLVFAENIRGRVEAIEHAL